MIIERTTDRDFINSVITHPRIYPHVAEDYAPAPEEFDCAPMLAIPAVHFLRVEDGGDPVGVFMVHPHTPIVYEGHTCILPKYWGRSVEAANLVVDWVFANTECLKLITLVPEDNRLAYRLARRVGMVELGNITESYLKGGKLINQFVLGIGKMERMKQCQ